MGPQALGRRFTRLQGTVLRGHCDHSHLMDAETEAQRS